MTHIVLSDDEQRILQFHFKTSPLALIRSKALAIRMAYKQGDPTEIADYLSVHTRTIHRWLQDFHTRRLASLFSGKTKNQNAAKLTVDQKNEIAQTLASPPSDVALPAAFWDIPSLKRYTQATFDVVYESDRSYHYLLEFSGLSFKYPDTFDRHRDEAAIAKRIEEIKAEIAPYLADNTWVVAAGDEVRIVLEALTRKAWLKKGERTIVKVERKREAQSYLGLLELNSGQCSIFPVSWQNQEEIIGVLTAYAVQHPGKRICLIWDNAAFHKGKLIRQALTKDGPLAMYHLINFPPYAPDENPIEKVWNYAKAKLANKQYENFDITKQIFEQTITSRTFSYSL